MSPIYAVPLDPRPTYADALVIAGQGLPFEMALLRLFYQGGTYLTPAQAVTESTLRCASNEPAVLEREVLAALGALHLRGWLRVVDEDDPHVPGCYTIEWKAFRS